MDRRIERSAGGFRGTGDLETQIPSQEARNGKSLTLMEAFSPYGKGKWLFSRGYLRPLNNGTFNLIPVNKQKIEIPITKQKTLDRYTLATLLASKRAILIDAR